MYRSSTSDIQIYIDKLDGYGVYVNYYVGNEVVIFPTFDDPNDDVAAAIIQTIYPDKVIAKINFVELYVDGGLAHCVTQQQPVSGKFVSLPAATIGSSYGAIASSQTSSNEVESSVESGNSSGATPQNEPISLENDMAKGHASTASLGTWALFLVGAWLVRLIRID